MNQGAHAGGLVLVGLEVDFEMQRGLAVGAGLVVGENAVGEFEDHLARLRRAVEEHERERGMEDHVGGFFRPAPDAALGHFGAVEIIGPHVAVAGGVDAREPLQTLGRDHGALDLFGAAEVEQHRFAEDVDAVFVAVQLVGLDGGQAVGEHVLRIHRVHLASRATP